MKLLIFLVLAILIIPLASAKGDCNSDGRITSVDALIALKMSVGKIEPNQSADMNNDGFVTSYDAFRILMLATGDEEELFFLLEDALQGYDLSKISGERMNWIIAKRDGSKLTIGVVVEGGKIKDFVKGEISNPTITAYTTEDTVRRLLASKSPDELRNALKNGDIRLEGVGIVNQIKVGFMNLLTKLVG
ncbi:MAG: dockerin type I repeat-containing protein [Archaeoglobaceae archaeon]